MAIKCWLNGCNDSLRGCGKKLGDLKIPRKIVYYQYVIDSFQFKQICPSYLPGEFWKRCCQKWLLPRVSSLTTVWHCSILCVIWLVILGHQTVIFNHIWLSSMPWCSLWVFISVFFWTNLATTILLLNSSKMSQIISDPLTFQYSLSAVSTSFFIRPSRFAIINYSPVYSVFLLSKAILLQSIWAHW